MKSFRVHFSANVTGFTGHKYNRLSWDVINPDETTPGAFNDGFMPVPLGGEPKRVIFTGQLWIIPPLGEPWPNYVARISKNENFQNSLGTSIATRAAKSQEAHWPADVPTWVATLNMQGTAQPGDVFNVWFFTESPTATLEPHRLHSYWAGTVL